MPAGPAAAAIQVAPGVDGLRALFIDAGGVLHLPDHSRVLDALAAAGLTASEDALDDAHYVAIAAGDHAAHAGEGWRAYRLAYARSIGIAPGSLEAAADVLEPALSDPETWKRPVDGAAEALRALVDAAVTVVVVSNADGTVERRLAEGLLCQVGAGEAASITAVLDSAVVGVSKPDARIFELALQAAGVPATAVVHVGDSVVFDVRGAEAAGVQAIHFDPLRICDDPSHGHVADLRELPGLVRPSASSDRVSS